MKKKKITWIIEILLFILIIGGFIFVGTRDFSSKVEVDNEKFDHDYKNVSSDNIFVYASASEILTTMKSGSAVVFMAYPNNQWSGYYASILNETAKEVGIDKILYYDFYEDRQNKNATYQSIVLRLSSYLKTLDNGKQNILAPTMMIIKNGQIIAFDDETSIMTGNISPEDYWDEYHKELKRNTFKTMFGEYLK